jgi:hypothetical protein
MWLLDVHMPKKIAAVLGEFGIQAQTADARGWKGLTNGAPVEVAVQAGFSCAVARDRLFGEFAARAWKRFPQFSVVLVAIPQLRGPEFLERFRGAWKRTPIQPVAGQLLRWPSA